VRSPLIKNPVTDGFPVLSEQVSPRYPQRRTKFPVSSYKNITNGHFLKYGRIAFFFLYRQPPDAYFKPINLLAPEIF